ncbi:hypothetical protein [Nonomuraea dietziae]|uniref:hypothetical protein n=1 Tax=Nonomuraea dietziae TaxID=65515 RepID=UPI0033E1370B
MLTLLPAHRLPVLGSLCVTFEPTGALIGVAQTWHSLFFVFLFGMFSLFLSGLLGLSGDQPDT